MIQASQMSRGIMPDKKANLGLADLMGGKKKVDTDNLVAPYHEHIKKPAGVPKGPAGGIGALMMANKGGGGGAVSKPQGPAGGMASLMMANKGSDAKKASPGVSVGGRSKPKDKSGLKCVGAGAGGVDEMATFLNEDTVQWGLLRFAIGSGTFKRNKMLLVHFSGINCSGLKRAKFNRNTPAAEKAFGDTNFKLPVEEKSEMSLENILEQTKHVFAGDSLGDYSIADMKADYESMVADTRKKAIEAMLKGDEETAKRKTAKEMGVTADEALSLVRKPMGAFNWVLFMPDPAKLELWDGGSLSVPEMLEVLPQDEVLCGLVRLGFGTGKFRRTKWVSIWWVGPKVSARKKGSVMGSAKDQMIRKTNNSGLVIEGADVDDVSLEAIVDTVKRAAVIDGDGVDGIGGARDTGGDPFSMDAFYAALEEEISANAEFFGEEKKNKSGRSFGLAATAKEVRAADGKYTWMLVETDA